MKSPELVCRREQSQPGACCTRFESEAGIRIDLRADRSAQVFLRRRLVSEIFQSLRFFSLFPGETLSPNTTRKQCTTRFGQRKRPTKRATGGTWWCPTPRSSYFIWKWTNRQVRTAGPWQPQLTWKFEKVLFGSVSVSYPWKVFIF